MTKMGNGEYDMKIKHDTHRRLLRVLDSLRFCCNLSSKSKLTSLNADTIIKKYHLPQKPEFHSKNKSQPEYDLMIIIPVYNSEKYLDECFLSVLSQKTEFSVSITVVDDGSTDASPQLLEKYKAYPNITVIHQENQGSSGARNTALKTIRGKYVMFLDSDDLLLPGAVQSLMEVAYRYHADVVAGGYETFWEDGRTEIERSSERVERISAQHMHGFTCMKVIRAELLRSFCFPLGFYYEDTIISKLLAPTCKNVYAIPDVVYRYRMHSNSNSTVPGKNKKHLDTYWITKYCLEESAKRGYALGEQEYMQYLQQSWVNWIRTKDMPIEIQEAMFVATASLYDQFFGQVQLNECEKKYKWMRIAMRKKSFSAYEFVMKRWEIL